MKKKIATVELIENLDKKIHNQITQYGSKVGVTIKNLREKETIVNEKILDAVFWLLGTYAPIV